MDMASLLADDPDDSNRSNATPTSAPMPPPPSKVHETPGRPTGPPGLGPGPPPPGPGLFATPSADNRPSGAPSDEPMYTSTTTSTRRNASGSVSSVYSGNKIRHLKKEDGIPLWRKDIQYDFLRLVFYDQTKCFTKYSENTKGFTFAEVYIDAMAKSSKCSKILKEKLLQDTEGAISMAMVCLLVNVGRMNTTLNFFPEMRAQLRTYHSIPALQAHQDPNAYKQLQDAPRLKSILKGATEDSPQPSTLEDIKTHEMPRTNPVNLIFVLSQFAPKISETHFVPPRDFYDLVMRGTLSSASRAKAFLWLVWWYLESDFTHEDTQRNPFGKGEFAEGEEAKPGVIPCKVPVLESLTEEQAALENVDTDEEMLYGEVKRKERIAILASEPSPAMTALKRARKEKGAGGHGYRSDDDTSETGWLSRPPPTSSTRLLETESVHTRSPSPALRGGFSAVNSASSHPQDMRINTLLNNEEAAPEAEPLEDTAVYTLIPRRKPGPKPGTGPGRGNWRRDKGKQPDTPTGRPAAEQHHVPLLPNAFVNETPTAAHIAPATPASGAYSAYSSTFPAQSSPQRAGGITFQPNASSRDHVPTPSYQAQKRNRGVTQHQSALLNHRKQQIGYTLDKRIRKIHIRARETREDEGSLFRAWKRIRLMPPDYDSEEELIRIRKARDRNEKDDESEKPRPHRARDDDFFGDPDMWRRPRVLMAGFVPMRGDGETPDAGEEARFLAKSLRRCSRRLERWQDAALPGQAMARRKELEAEGRLSPQAGTPPGSGGFFERDGVEVVDGPSAPRSNGRANNNPHRQRSGGVGRANDGRRSRGPREDVKMEYRGEDDEGGGELDEEDRELLGEVDVDESDEDQDGDEEMADD